VPETSAYAQKLAEYTRVRDEYWEAREELCTLIPGTPAYHEREQVLLVKAGECYKLAQELDLLLDIIHN